MIRRIRNLTVTGQTALTLILAACFDRPVPTESSIGPIVGSIFAPTPQSDDFASGNSITVVGGTAEVNLDPAGAIDNIYTVHYFVTTTINAHSSQYGTATLVVAIETNDGSGWVERSTYTYQCSYLTGPPPWPARTCTGTPGGGSHEQKSVTVAGLGLNDDIRLRAKTFSTDNGAGGSFVVRGGDAGGSNPETYNGVTYTADVAVVGAPTPQSDDFASGNSITVVGGTAQVNLDPAEAIDNTYTVHYFVTTTINAHSSQFGTATLVVAIETNDGSGWVERSTYTYQCSYLSGPPPWPARTCTGAPGGGSHEQKSVTVAGLGLDDDIRLRAKTFSTDNGAGGSFVVRGGDAGGSNPETYSGVTYTKGNPDPTLLPAATIAQVPLTANYNNLHLPDSAAGSSYPDPTTRVRIYKLTSAFFPPVSTPYWGHDYAEGGDEISLPYIGIGTTNTRAVLVRGLVGGNWQWWLLDFTPGVGVGNARPLTGRLAPWSDGAFTFSSNPATPQYAYVGNSTSRVERINIATMMLAPGDGWPRENEPEVAWLHQSENDAFFTWMRGKEGPDVVGFEPSSAGGTLKVRTVSNVDQPEINRNSGVRQVAINTQSEQPNPDEFEGLKLWDFALNVEKCSAPGSGGGQPQFNHMGALRDGWIGLNWRTSAPHNYHVYDTNCSYHTLGTVNPPSGQGSAHDYYANGNWNQPQASPDNQWALFSIEKGLEPDVGSGYLAPGGMVYVKGSGERYLLGHPYNTVTWPSGTFDSAKYPKLSFAKQSSDGRYVLFTSDMNGSPRSDVFLVEVPVR